MPISTVVAIKKFLESPALYDGSVIIAGTAELMKLKKACAEGEWLKMAQDAARALGEELKEDNAV